MENLLQDFRFAWRMLIKNPGITAIIVLTTALGIGANTTIFSWIRSTLLDPIPGITDTGNLVSITRGQISKSPSPPCSYPDYRDLRDKSRSFSGLLAYHDNHMSLTGNTKPERTFGTLVSANYFEVLGVKPILGRGFLPEEETQPGGAPVVVISYDVWQNRFRADPSILGRTIGFNRNSYSIVGVAPPGFQGCKTGLKSELWVPLMMDPLVYSGKRLQRRDTFWLNLLGRLRPGVDRRQAQEEMNLLMQQIVEQFPESHKGPNNITMDPLWRSPFGANAYLYSTLPLLMTFAGVVLLLACANVANLLLVRLAARRREMAVRLSLGAGRLRLVRQLLVESLLLALVGGGIAALFTSWSAGMFTAFIPPTENPTTLNGRLDHTVLLGTLIVSILTGIIFGILPALRSSSLTPMAVLKEESGSISSGRRRARLSSVLVIVQISLSMFLLTCAGLLARSLWNARQLDPGFDPDHVLLASYELSPAGYSTTQGIEFNQQLIAKLEVLPGMESVTLSDFVPLRFSKRTEIINPESYVPQPRESMEVSYANVAPSYHRTLRIPLIAGREFTNQDAASTQPVVVVNQALGDRYWPRQDAIGKRLFTRGKWFTVVGVARNSHYFNIHDIPVPFLYLPLFQNYNQAVTLHARVSGDPLASASQVERVIRELNPDLPIFQLITLKSSIETGSVFERIAGTLVGMFGLVSLALAAIGIYGVISHTTLQRSHEIGIRLALGAQRYDIFRLVLMQGLRLMLIGLGIGLVLSGTMTRFLRRMLLGIEATDMLTFTGVALLLSIVVLVACLIPALRAMRVNPTVTLRYE